jgi:hypothetical protein
MVRNLTVPASPPPQIRREPGTRRRSDFRRAGRLILEAMRRNFSSALLAALAFTSLFLAPARASLVIALDLPELTSRAERVVVAQVLSVSARWDSQHRTIYSTVELAVAEIWKGALPGRLTIIQVGGEVDGITMRVHGLPDFTAGERAVLFLQGPAASSQLVGLGQGKRLLRFDAREKRWLAAPGDRSAAVRLDEGKLVPAAPEPALFLDELRERVRGLLRNPAP